MLRRAAHVLVVVATVSASIGVVGSSAQAAAEVVPNAGVTSASGWTATRGAALAFDPAQGALVARRGADPVLTVVSSLRGAPVRRGTTVSIAGEVRTSRTGVPVTVEVREVDPTSGRTVRTATARRTTTTTGPQWYGAQVTTTSALARIRIVVSARTSDRPTLRIAGFSTRVGPADRRILWTESPASRWVDAHPDDPDAQLLADGIARHPVSTWLLGEENPYARLATLAGQAQRDFSTLLVTPYYVPLRYDGLSPEAGAPSVAAYRDFTDRVADAIGSARAIVVLEPDALWFYAQVKRRVESEPTRSYCEPGLGCYDDAMLAERRAALRYAVNRYSALERTTVYVEAGTSSGAVTPAEMASALAEIGVGGKVGFAVNVSSYAPESAITRYALGVRLALAARGRPNVRYVVDTGRNGNPAWTGRDGDEDGDGQADVDTDGDGDADDRDLTAWCNPDGQRLGRAPGTPTALQQRLGRDLNLWVKGPGESDGDCGAGPGTVGGEFMPDVAAGMVGVP